MAFIVSKWENMPKNAKPILFEITYSYSSSVFRVSTKSKIDLFSINQWINSGNEKKIFKLLVLHFENLLAFYFLDQAHKYLKIVGQHPVTGKSFFLFHQITPICWELQFLPFAKYFRKFSFFMDNFISVRFRLDEDSANIFLFQELKTGELIPDFYEMFKKILNRGEAGDNAGILLRGVEKKDIQRGMVICKPKSVTPHSKFKAEIYVLSKEEGGRHTPFFTKYRPQFYLRTTDVTGEVVLPEGIKMVMPGDNVTIEVSLINSVAMEKGLRFAVREGGRTIGAGQVVEILD